MAPHLDLLQGRRGIKQHTSYLCDGSSNHDFMLNVGIGKMRTLVEGPRTSFEDFRSDGQTGTSDVDHSPMRSSNMVYPPKCGWVLKKRRRVLERHFPNLATAIHLSE
jgi:hypothetical protein